MQVFKTPSFADWAENEQLADEDLAQAVLEMERGLSGDALGSSVYKKRVPLRGKGKSGGARTVVAYRQGDIAVFMYGFSKGERASISRRELAALRMYAKQYLGYSEDGWNHALRKGAIQEVEYHGEKNKKEDN
jgi:hypothetical protein